MNNCMYEQIISVLEGRVTNYFHNICNLLESHHVNENVDHNNKRFSARADLSPIKEVLNVINDQYNYSRMTQRDFEMTCLSIYHYNEEVGIIMMLCFVLLLMMGCVYLSDGCFPFPPQT